jgi:hypothetical protein
VTLDAGWNFPLVNVREPVTYRLQIEYGPEVQVLPESIAPAALRRVLVRATALLPELFDVAEAGKKTQPLPGERTLETVDYTLRFSKPGVYHIPSLPIAYSVEKSQHTLQSTPQQGHVLTVDAHLPAGAGALPGDILTPPRLLRRPWFWLRYVALALLASGGVSLVVGLWPRVPRRPAIPHKKRLSPRQLRRKYEAELAPLRARMPVTTGVLAAAERAWLHACAALVRRLLGDWSSAEPACFAGGAGVSASMITAHLHVSTPGQQAFLEPALQLLQELDGLAAAPAPVLTAAAYQHFSEAVAQTILRLTSHEASRVFRASADL